MPRWIADIRQKPDATEARCHFLIHFQEDAAGDCDLLMEHFAVPGFWVAGFWGGLDVLVEGFGGEDGGEGLEDAHFHAGDAANVDEGAGRGEHGGELIAKGAHTIVHVHGFRDRGAIGCYFAADSRRVGKVRIGLGEVEEVLVIEKIGGVGRAHDEGSFGVARSGIVENVEEHAAEWGDSGARGEEEEIVLREVGGENEAFAARAGDVNFVAYLEIAEVVGSYAQEKAVVVVVFIDGAFDGCGEDVALTIFAACWGGD